MAMDHTKASIIIVFAGSQKSSAWSLLHHPIAHNGLGGITQKAWSFGGITQKIRVVMVGSHKNQHGLGWITQKVSMVMIGSHKNSALPWVVHTKTVHGHGWITQKPAWS
jgi:hypothetical protein